VKAFVFLSAPEVLVRFRPRECVRRARGEARVDVRHPAISRDDGGAARSASLTRCPGSCGFRSIPSASAVGRSVQRLVHSLSGAK